MQFRTTTRIELIVRAPSGAAFVNQALAMKLPGLAPSGFNPHAFAHSGLRAPLTSGLRTVLQDDLPDLPRSPGGHHHRLVADRPNGLSAAWPCLQRAFAAYPRPGEAGPAVFHGPIARGLALDSPGLPRPPTLTSRPPAAARSRSRGFAAPASRTAEKRLFTALTLGLGAARKSGGVKQFAAFLAREN